MRLSQFYIVILIVAIITGCSSTGVRSIKSLPQNANVYSYAGEKYDTLSINRKKIFIVGKTPFTTDITSSNWYKVGKLLYLESEWIWLPKSDNDQAHVFQLNPAVKSLGHLSVKCNGEFYIGIDIDSTNYDADNLFVKDLAPGRYVITVWKDYFIKEEFEIIIRSGHLTSCQVTLIPKELIFTEQLVNLSQGEGKLIILTGNSGTEVVINDRSYYPPVEFDQIPAGNIKIIINYNGKTRTINTVIDAGEIKVVNLDKE